MDYTAPKCLIFLIICSLTLISAQDCSVYDDCESCNESDDCVWGYCQNEEITILSGEQGCVFMTTISDVCQEGEMFEVMTNCSEAENSEATPSVAPGTTQARNSTVQQGTTIPVEGASTIQQGETTIGEEQTTIGEEQTTIASEEPDATDNATQYMPSSGSSFDAASFIGGIVLCGGLILVVFLGCKFYESRNKNYHTL